MTTYNVKKIIFLKIFTAFLLVSGVIIVLVYNITGMSNFYIVKDLSVLLMFLLCFLLYLKQFGVGVFYPLSFVAIIAICGVIFSNASLFLIIASLRQFIIPFMFIVIGYSFIRCQEDYNSIAKFIIINMIFVMLFGVYERFFNLWSFLDVSGFYGLKNIPVFSNGYPVFWIEPLSLFGYSSSENGMPRMVSTILDPINLGHLLVFTFALVFYEGEKFFRKWAWLCIMTLFFAGIFFTFSKGAWLQFFLVFFVFNTRISYSMKALLCAFSLVPIFFYIKLHAGFLLHFLGFVSVFKYVDILGHGLGSFGNYSHMYSDNSVGGVGDSYWAAVLGQFGVLGFVVWVSTFMCFSKKIGRHYLSWLLISQVLISALSENTFNFMSVFLLMIFVGGSLRLSDKEKNLKMSQRMVDVRRCENFVTD